MAKKSSNFKFKKILLLSLIVVALVCFFGYNRYRTSSILLEQGNQLLKQGQSEQAISVFNEAHNQFPFREDIMDNLKGANLVQQSYNEFSKITQVDAEIENAELQNIPSIVSLPEQNLKPNEQLVPI